MAAAGEIGYPLVVRPSYVLGGRAMEIVHEPRELERYMREAVKVSEKSPVLLDRFLDDAIEVDVDCISDGSEVMIGGIMEHVEQAGIHSGDSACSLPPYSLPAALQDEMRRQTVLMAKALKVVGLMNVQFAIQRDAAGAAAVVYVLEVNPRASRTVPFVSKATGQPLAKIAARCMVGQRLSDQRNGDGRAPHEIVPGYYSVKEAVFPFNKFPGVDPILGPEMRSTGEVMGTGRSFGEAMLKSQLGAGSRLPTQGTVCITVKNDDKPRAVAVARALQALGFAIVATKGTAAAIAEAGVPVRAVNKVKDGRPHIVDMLKAGEIQLVFTTVDETRTAIADSRHIRQAALAHRVTYYTSMAGCEAAVEGMKHQADLTVFSLQELHAQLH
jgi:carbamoyl-phosphate synthase large subunit